ncbi:MAG: histidine--tRNA ligase [Clostridiales bacterium]|jgi:histidyl-tRNA synthetase|nr:histidine--tRNA ligase [Clostridiales bacterium]
MINVPKGTKDVLPSDSCKWQALESAAREVARLYNANEIRTPAFEYTELFLRGVGDTTDIVNKEMYTFEDKGGRSITLKPEGTAGAVRSFIENNLAESLYQKVFYFTPVFRYERPQAGRLREHHQFGVEFFGSAEAGADAEVISLAHTFLNKIGISGLTLYINSIGCPTCRAEYNKALTAYLSKKSADLCPVCNDRITRNPLRVLDCKIPECKQALVGAPKIIDFLCADCGTHFGRLRQALQDFDIPYEINPDIVRGLDYYTRTVFEFVSNGIGAQGTVCGGGRYDNLVQSLGGKSTPACGFGMGLERLLLTLESLGKASCAPRGPDVYVATADSEGKAVQNAAVSLLRRNGISVETDRTGRGLKSQIARADKLEARRLLVLGATETSSGIYTVKNMSTGETAQSDFDRLPQTVKAE